MDEYFPAMASAPCKNIFPGVTVKTSWLNQLMLSWAELEPNAVVEEHQHPHEQMGMVFSGSARFIIGGVEKLCQPGDWYRIPGNVRHKVIALADGLKALDVFSPTREDYK